MTGIDASAAMLAELRRKPGGELVGAVGLDMRDPYPGDPYDVVFVAYNTLFNVTDVADQRLVFGRVAAALRPGGAFVVEAFVPAGTDAAPPGGAAPPMDLRQLAAERVVLSVHRHDAANQRVEGSYIELSNRHGVRLRPWSIRYCTPEQLDDMAGSVGLVMERRCSTWSGAPYTCDAEHHVTTYRLPD
ncbi:MAG: class I SAM-dependent methyltransferase [Ilumatobacteraceae bacterium]